MSRNTHNNNRQEHIPAKPAADVAQILDTAQVPNVLFGWLPVGLIGKDRGARAVEFVIPDSHLQTAITALVAAKFSLCTDHTCLELDEDPHPHRHLPEGTMLPNPIARVHFHLSKYPHFTYTYTILSLFPKSTTLWWIPDTEFHSPPPADSTLTQTTNPTLSVNPHGTGPWPSLYPIRILTPCALTKSLLLLLCRDYGHVRYLDKTWISMLGALMCEEGGKCNPLAGEISRGLEGGFRGAWEGLRGRDGDEDGGCLKQFHVLRDKVVGGRGFPALPGVRYCGEVTVGDEEDELMNEREEMMG